MLETNYFQWKRMCALHAHLCALCTLVWVSLCVCIYLGSWLWTADWLRTMLHFYLNFHEKFKFHFIKWSVGVVCSYHHLFQWNPIWIIQHELSFEYKIHPIPSTCNFTSNDFVRFKTDSHQKNSFWNWWKLAFHDKCVHWLPKNVE